MSQLRDQFLLDPEVTFLNHGSFGATPRPVFAEYQAWQRRLESQPVKLLGREISDLLRQSRHSLAAFVNAGGDDLVYVPNATNGVNIVARSLALGPGDEVLTSNQEYGACVHIWQFLSAKRGFTFKQQPIPLPVPDDDDFVELLWQGVTPRTKVIFLSHITSATATILPVAAVCARARRAGILTLIDGAHAVGQLPLDLMAMDPDFYTSNAHKWLCAPKGSAFLYVRPDQQPFIEPLVVSWGWGTERTYSTGSDLIDYLEWSGTNDYSAYLAVPAAIQFQAAHDWPAVRARCHGMLQETLARLDVLIGLDSLYRTDQAYAQMAVAALPAGLDPLAVKEQLYDQFAVELPVYAWEGRNMMRISVQGYNSPADVDRLVDAVGRI